MYINIIHRINPYLSPYQPYLNPATNAAATLTAAQTAALLQGQHAAVPQSLPAPQATTTAQASTTPGEIYKHFLLSVSIRFLWILLLWISLSIHVGDNISVWIFLQRLEAQVKQASTMTIRRDRWALLMDTSHIIHIWIYRTTPRLPPPPPVRTDCRALWVIKCRKMMNSSKRCPLKDVFPLLND